MTLNTLVYAMDRVRPLDVFAKCSDLIGAPAATRFTNEPEPTWRDGERTIEPGSPWLLSNSPGQGLCAWMDVRYLPDEPLRTPDQAAECDTYCDPDCSEAEHDPACWLWVSFDTSYSCRDDEGRGCGDLHASLVADLGNWLDGRGVRWRWRNEFSGEVHEGYDRLIDLCTDGFAAQAWFTTTALPAIAAEIRERSGGRGHFGV
jgi:hypothetical protein